MKLIKKSHFVSLIVNLIILVALVITLAFTTSELSPFNNISNLHVLLILSLFLLNIILLLCFKELSNLKLVLSLISFAKIPLIFILCNYTQHIALNIYLFFEIISFILSTFLYLSNDSKTSSEMACISQDDFINMESRDRAKLINSLSGVKSSNLIGSVSSDGITNLSIISSLFHLGASPALVGFIMRPDTVPRDTLDNIRESGCFTINHVNSDILERAHQTSARYPKDESEFEKCGLTEEFLNELTAPFVKESKIKMSIDFIREQKIQENGTILIIGKITNIYAPKDSILKDNSLDIVKADSIGVIGLDGYVSLSKLNKLSYAKPDKVLTKIIWE